MKVVDDVVAGNIVGPSTAHSSVNRRNTNRITESLILAAVDETVHLDGVYFLLRREPSVLLKALSGSKDSGSQKRKRDVIRSMNGNDEKEDEKREGT